MNTMLINDWRYVFRNNRSLLTGRRAPLSYKWNALLRAVKETVRFIPHLIRTSKFVNKINYELIGQRNTISMLENGMVRLDYIGLDDSVDSLFKAEGEPELHQSKGFQIIKINNEPIPVEVLA